MNLKLSLGAFALLTEVAQGKLRGRRYLEGPPSNKYWEQTIPWYRGKSEAPKCKGSVCGLWGDPHIQSCDETNPDKHWGCQVEGTVDLMENDWYHIQATFSPIGDDAIDQVRDKMVKQGQNSVTVHNVGATVTTDLAFEFKDLNTTLQFGYGNINSPTYEDGTAILGVIPQGPHKGRPYFPTEQYCNIKQFYQGEKRTIKNVWMGECATECQEDKACTHFNWWSSKVCELILVENPTLTDTKKHEGRVVSGRSRTGWGDTQTCGHWENKGIPEELWPQGTNKSKKYHRKVGGWKKCPLLFFLDGEMQDISQMDPEQLNAESGHKTPLSGYFYGDANSDLSAKILRQDGAKEADAIQILHNRDGSKIEIIIELSGSGQAEMWACSFKMNICLPEEIKDKIGTTVGMLGSPDGDKTNDMNDKDGNPFDNWQAVQELKNRDAYEDKPDKCLWDLAKLEYCHDTFCVEKKKHLIMTPAPGQNKDDLMCEPVDDTCAKEHCVLSDAALKDVCGLKPQTNDQAVLEDFETCRIECCHDAEECEDVTKFGDDDETDDDIRVEGDTEAPSASPGHCVEGEEFPNTGSTACPGHNIVKILRGPPDNDPADVQDIFYDINTLHSHESERSVSFRVNNPFGVEADVYVSHDKRAREDSNFPEPTCEGRLGVEGGCDPRAENEITVPCITYAGSEPFAMVNVYFVSKDASFPDVDPEAEVKRCCIDKDERDTLYSDPEYKVIHYAFQVECGCPDIRED